MSLNVAEPGNSEWASRIVFDPKKDGSVSLCVNHRRLNSVIMIYSYSIQITDEIVHPLWNLKVFSTLDANIVYWKI